MDKNKIKKQKRYVGRYAVFLYLYRKLRKSSKMVYNKIEIKNDTTKERRGVLHRDVVYGVFCFLAWLHWLTVKTKWSVWNYPYPITF